MKYHQPYDQPSSPNAPYVNGNPATGTQGSIPPAAQMEYPQREIVAAITDIGLAAPSDSDLDQLSKAIQFMRPQYLVDAGAVNAISVTLSPAPTAWAIPLCFFAKMAYTNTSTAVTAAIAGIAGTKTVVKRDGTALSVSDLAAGAVHLFVYDGTSLRVATMLVSDVSGPGLSTAGHGNVSLVYTSATQLTLYPRGPGAVVVVNAVPIAVGASGLAIANTGVEVGGAGGQSLADNTTYDLYLKNVGGVLTPSFYADSGGGTHTRDTTTGNIGVEVHTGPDSTRTLIGKVYTNGSGQFVAVWVLDWFYRRGIAQQNAQGAVTGSTTSSTLAEVTNSGNRIYGIAWGDEMVFAWLGGYAGASSNYGYAACVLVNGNQGSYAFGPISAAPMPSFWTGYVTEGLFWVGAAAADDPQILRGGTATLYCSFGYSTKG